MSMRDLLQSLQEQGVSEPENGDSDWADSSDDEGGGGGGFGCGSHGEEPGGDDDDTPFEVLERRRQDGFAMRPSTSQPGVGPVAARGRATAASKGGRQQQQQQGGGFYESNKNEGKEKEQSEQQSFKRAHKNAPVEMSSKKPVGRFRDVMQAGKNRSVDPRFDTLAAGAPAGAGAGAATATAAAQQKQWRRRYSFVFDEVLPQERTEIKAALKKTKSAGKRAGLQARLAEVEARLQSERDKRKTDERKDKVKSAEKRAVEQGKSPYFQKKADVRRQELLQRYEELKSEGKLEAYLAKRRKRNAAKDHRYLPSKRRAVAEDGG